MSTAPTPPPADGPLPFALELPGYTLPLDFLPPSPCRDDDLKTYRNALIIDHVTDSDIDRVFTGREATMLRIMNKITETPEWEIWVHDTDIVSEWWDKYKVEKEVSSNPGDSAPTHQGVVQQNLVTEYLFSDLVLPEGISSEGPAQHSADVEEVTSKMKQCVISELRYRAEHFRRAKAVMVFDACIKSDNVIPSDLREALADAVHAMKADQTIDKKGEQMFAGKFDIVDPNCVPLIYDRCKILTDRQIGLQDCISAGGAGEILPMRGVDHPDGPWWDVRYQQLPCDVSLSEDRCRIVSYINNIHPDHHQKLYTVIEDILTRAIPMLNEALSYYESPLRIDLPQDLDPRADVAGFEGVFPEDLGFCKWEKSDMAEIPEPLSFESRNPVCGNEHGADSLRTKLEDGGLQVIVRIESIELTPVQPEITEEEWHLEGLPNEHICATAAHCYEAQNVTEQTFSFRQRFDFTNMFDNEPHYGETWIDYLDTIFPHLAESDIPENMTVTQDLGPVSFPPGRLLTFPNVFQQQRSGMSLVDKSKPGHCKTLFLYLVDPHIRIISTANVPPLRDGWCENRAAMIDCFLLSRLPAELVIMVENELGDDMLPPITASEARVHRDLMISVRAALTDRHNFLFENDRLPAL